MEAVAATASVTGILAFVGHSIDGIVKLKEFYASLSSISKTVERFLHDINALLHTLQGVQSLLGRLPEDKTDVNLIALDIQVEACSNDLNRWLGTAKIARSASNKGGRTWFRKFWMTVNKHEVKDIRSEIGKHRQALEVSLTLIGR